MTKYQEFNGAQHLRPWAARTTVNFKNGMVYRPGTGLHIDHMNIPVNRGTSSGSRKTDYHRRKVRVIHLRLLCFTCVAQSRLCACFLAHVAHLQPFYVRYITGFTVQELENHAKETMRIRDKIQAVKPVYSTEKLEHEYLENVARIDRLCTFRGPPSANHRSRRVRENLEVAKSMLMTKHRPGTSGFRSELSRSIKQQRSQSARTPGRCGALSFPHKLM